MAIRRIVAGAGATRGAQPTGPTTTLGSRVSIIVSPGLVIFMATPPTIQPPAASGPRRGRGASVVIVPNAGLS